MAWGSIDPPRWAGSPQFSSTEAADGVSFHPIKKVAGILLTLISMTSVDWRITSAIKDATTTTLNGLNKR